MDIGIGASDPLGAISACGRFAWHYGHACRLVGVCGLGYRLHD